MKSRKSITHSENRFAKGKGFDNIKPIFSFAEYKNSDLFKIEDCTDKSELHKFLSRLANFSKFTWGEIKRSGKFHFHIVDYDKKVYKLIDDKNLELHQFKVQGDGEARIIGYFNTENIFCIVAYDYNHQLYPKA